MILLDDEFFGAAAHWASKIWKLHAQQVNPLVPEYRIPADGTFFDTCLLQSIGIEIMAFRRTPASSLSCQLLSLEKNIYILSQVRQLVPLTATCNAYKKVDID